MAEASPRGSGEDDPGRDEDLESIAEQLDMFPPTNAGYDCKVGTTAIPSSVNKLLPDG